MKKKYIIFSTILLTIFLTSCAEKPIEITPINPEDTIIMEELDEFMFRDDVQYVDLRNYQSSFRSGFIYSFEQIPFFDYLDNRVFDRDNTYDFEPSQLLDEEGLTRLFDKDKAILLFADGCIRSGYLKDALNYLGYERVYVLGGFYEYQGEYKIFGDGEYEIGSTFYSKFTDQETLYEYHIYGTFEMDKSITGIRIDILDETGISLRTMIDEDDINYDQQLTILEDFMKFNIVTFTSFKEMYLETPIENQVEIPGYTLGFTDALKATIIKLIP